MRFVTSRPIADYAMLSDCHSAALVSREGSIDWLCMPRFDSPSLCGRILDDHAGHWLLRPMDIVHVTRRYRERTLVLETSFVTKRGLGRLVDVMAFGEGERDHQIGLSSPHLLLRELTCLEGSLDVEFELAPRPDYGAQVPDVQLGPEGAEFASGATRLVLSSDLPLAAQAGSLRGVLSMRAGETRCFALGSVTGLESSLTHLSPVQISHMIEDTTQGWLTWSGHHQNYEGPWSDLVHRSGCVMQGLTYRRTGAMVAAPTTSLPEEIGGVRNWDYRYSWLRDSSMTLRALWVAACPDEAGEYFRWIAETAERDAALGLDLQIVYGVGGERELEERVLEGLRGWRDSGPVRIGNGAGGQLQIDVYGEILDARSGDMGGSRSPEALRTLETHVLGRPGSGHRHGG